MKRRAIITASRGIAEIAKTPEPMRPIQSLGRGKFIAIFEKTAQPDYKGTLKGGGAIVFEAKHTDADRLQQSAVTEEQAKRLDRHSRLGAECFVIVSFGFERYFKVPWEVFRDMKARYGRKYITPEDVKRVRVQVRRRRTPVYLTEEGNMGIVIAILISFAISIPIAILWVHGIDKMKDDPEWQEHKDDPDYWDWP